MRRRRRASAWRTSGNQKRTCRQLAAQQALVRIGARDPSLMSLSAGSERQRLGALKSLADGSRRRIRHAASTGQVVAAGAQKTSEAIEKISQPLVSVRKKERVPSTLTPDRPVATTAAADQRSPPSAECLGGCAPVSHHRRGRPTSPSHQHGRGDRQSTRHGLMIAQIGWCLASARAQTWRRAWRRCCSGNSALTGVTFAFILLVFTGGRLIRHVRRVFGALAIYGTTTSAARAGDSSSSGPRRCGAGLARRHVLAQRC
jgi:hypothetical protein